MKARSGLCIPLVATLAFCLALTKVAAKGSSDTGLLRGVAPAIGANLYQPDKRGQWKCLDKSKMIPFSALNDDYCDCPDGSDEPGTSACGTGHFYCANQGHVSSSIKSSRVNDGVCDPECCDGSDEYDGQVECPNLCQEMGALAREERERVEAIQKEGSKLRKEYIAYGKEAKQRLQQQLELLQAETKELAQAALDTKDAWDKAYEEQEEYLERSKVGREDLRRTQLAPLVEEQSRRLEYASEQQALLRTALENLKENYNKNYHDLAVKDTISGFDDHISGLTGNSDSDSEAVIPTGPMKTAAEVLEEGGSPEDHVNALMDETFTAQREIGVLFDLLAGMRNLYNQENNDAAVMEAVKFVEAFEENWDAGRQEFKDDTPLEIPAEDMDDSPEAEAFKERTEEAQEVYDAAAKKERDNFNDIRDIERKLKMDFGEDETFAKLLDTCFDYRDIEYTYTVCLFANANQRSQSTTFLGKFSRWEGGNYDTQIYSGGNKCWNGPDRSVKLVMTCGTTNEIISVSEPEKCEYLFKLQTPAVCPILPDDEEAKEQDEAEEEESESRVQETTKTHDEL